MNNEQINSILEDLYAVDPAFKKREPEIRKIIEQLLSLKPSAEINEDFKRQLKYNLIERLEGMEINNKNSFDLAKFLRYFVPGIALIALLVLAGGYLYKSGGMKFAQNLRPNIKKNIASDFSKIQITGEKDLAFGSLTGGSAANNATNSSGTSAPNKSSGTANGVAPSPMFAPAMGLGGGGGVASPNMRIRAPMYNFEYKGDPIKLTDSKLDVLKKDKPSLQGSDANSLIGSMGFGLADLSSFDNATLQQFSIAQEIPFGYNINVSLIDSSISIYQQWDQWPGACKQDVCPPIQPLKPENIPDDTTLIGIAKDFVSQHKINTDAYGDPIVQTNYRQIYYATPPAMRADYFVPDQINVLYPLVIDGKTAYDGSGNPIGMTVGVDIRNNKVASVWGITSHTYQSSAYDAETDFKKILDYATKGGYNSIYYNNPDQKGYTTLELDAPTIQWMDYYQYKGGENTELLAPALVFPIKNPPADLYQKNVVVPLITDILNNVATPPIGIQPMNQMMK